MELSRPQQQQYHSDSEWLRAAGPANLAHAGLRVQFLQQAGRGGTRQGGTGASLPVDNRFPSLAGAASRPPGFL